MGPNTSKRTLSHLSKVFFAALCLAVAACGGGNKNNRKEGDLQFLRLERVIMDTPADQLHDALQDFRTQFPSPLLTIVPDDPTFMRYAEDYRADSIMRHIDKTVKQRYGDLGWLERKLTDALRQAQKMDSKISYSHFATFIGSSGYDSRVRADRESGSLVVAIDQYVLPQMESFGYFGDPQYIVHLSDSAYILGDCIEAIAKEHIAMPDEPWSLLDYMIAEGKSLYLMEELLPDTPDSIRLRYTEQQLAWMKQQESNVWAYLLQNNMLFTNDFARFHNIIDEAPKTNAFGNESAPRAAAYIGWQIVRKYMKKSGVSLHELFENTNSQMILSESTYRP